MFSMAVFLSVLMAVTAWGAYRLSKYWLTPVWWVIWAAVLIEVLTGSTPPAVGWLFLFLIVALAVGIRTKLSNARFAGACAGCFVLAFVVAIVQYIPIYRGHQRILARFPAVDLKPRLAYERQATKSALRLPPADQSVDLQNATSHAEPVYQSKQLTSLQNSFGKRGWKDGGGGRSRDAFQALSEVHAGFVADFIAQPSVFGFTRIRTMRIVRESDISPDQQQLMSQPPQLIPQPAVPDKTSGSPREDEGELRADILPMPQLPGFQPTQSKLLSKEFLSEQNHDNVASFASPNSLGAVNKQIEARGFQPHAFREPPGNLQLPDSQEKWVLQRLELISLLKHDPPAVYVSEHLPAMNELVDAPTRATNAFEIDAISQLRRGEEIVTDLRPAELQMVGAIRAIDECRKCHQVPRGALLGAFSYRFRSLQAPVVPNRAKVPKPLALRGWRLVNPADPS
ncbi:MAG: hypothetical protein JWN70_4121 [Planctomycetaceae bacterium]|nr:hypothetical protein [Planctomycetaceae bacterium]